MCYYLKEWKTLWQKELLLIMSNFFFCHNVFKSCLLQRCQKASTFGKRLTKLKNVFQLYCVSSSPIIFSWLYHTIQNSYQANGSVYIPSFRFHISFSVTNLINEMTEYTCTLMAYFPYWQESFAVHGFKPTKPVLIASVDIKRTITNRHDI